MKRVLVLSAATVALACAGVAAVAMAHTVNHPTTVSIHLKKQGHKPDSFDGKVTSDTPRCEASRTVKVKMGGTPATVVGATTTDVSGGWALQLSGDAQPGSYYAVAIKKVLRKNRKHHHVCSRGLSSTLTVH